MTHWEKAIVALKNIYERRDTNDEPFVKLRGSTGAMNSQIAIEIRYTHRTLGTRMDEIILFDDGTWRMRVF